MSTKIILDLCGGTGAWSRPYLEAGYDVRLITLPEQDVRTYQPPKNVHGVLAAPPCTEFARCGARWWKTKPPHLLEEAIEIVKACLRIAEAADAWWALENPLGRLDKFIGPPSYRFHPWHFGDPWTKYTLLWGRFTEPKRLEGAQKPIGVSVPGHRSQQHFRTKTLEERMLAEAARRPDWIHKPPPSADRAALRSITPPGFAKAFFEANP